MNLRFKSLALASVIAIGLLGGGSGPAKGEEDLGTITRTTEFGPYRYKIYNYPSKTNAFLMYPQSYVTFDMVNGNFWQIESPRWFYDDQLMGSSGLTFVAGSYYPLAQRPDKLAVTFYTPDMKQLGRYDGPVRAEHYLPVPRDGNDYERIICKIECESEWHWDIKMRVWDSVDPVMAEPMSNPIYRQ